MQEKKKFQKLNESKLNVEKSHMIMLKIAMALNANHITIGLACNRNFVEQTKNRLNFIQIN